MKNLGRLAISTLLTYNCLAFARVQTQSPQQQNQQETSTELSKVCSQKNPPPCATPPRVISAPSPQFSESAHVKELSGVCVLSVNVEPDGSTSHIYVLRSVEKNIDEMVIKAVKRWKFKPAVLDGKPVAVQIAVEVSVHIR